MTRPSHWHSCATRSNMARLAGAMTKRSSAVWHNKSASAVRHQRSQPCQTSARSCVSAVRTSARSGVGAVMSSSSQSSAHQTPARSVMPARLSIRVGSQLCRSNSTVSHVSAVTRQNSHCAAASVVSASEKDQQQQSGTFRASDAVRTSDVDGSASTTVSQRVRASQWASAVAERQRQAVGAIVTSVSASEPAHKASHARSVSWTPRHGNAVADISTASMAPQYAPRYR